MTNWFDRNGRAYARFRPDYPPDLSDWLAQIAPSTRQAVDVGCGSGQLTAQLARHFAGVIGLDPSGDQIENATSHPRIGYICSSAEALPVADHSTDLITAAQAAHWFDRPAFYAEARRIAAPNAVIALISYGVLQIDDPELAQRFARFYRDDIGPFWPPERKLVDEGYAGIDFPFAEIPTPDLSIRLTWRLADVMGYLATWSAVRRAIEADQQLVLDSFAAEFSALWGDPEQARQVAWPIKMRVGHVI
ncbi:class I SAM-dependent methyltransferase [Paracoccus sp. 11-3]|uniref:Class I SAM-dependent methyltransferase n=1 Tax=Paracoccus amoyensis TaxID=2760093 RepID=A0A926GLH4_9RHOB|nr:class I SAM-dependent methyltransferase [Paracoccus amoyensis]MBC9246140.1 class I SAM-dependent methyltransferase [Paracoccus amoyensis]